MPQAERAARAQAGILSEVSANERVGHGGADKSGVLIGCVKGLLVGARSKLVGLKCLLQIQGFYRYKSRAVEYNGTLGIQEVMKLLPLMKTRKGNMLLHVAFSLVAISPEKTGIKPHSCWKNGGNVTY